jgi:hypothetical protein
MSTAARSTPADRCRPRWSADGRRLYYREADWIMVKPVVGETGEPVEPEPRSWVESVDTGTGLCNWDLAPD